jgi:uncharacterized iron-regulated protein
LTDLSLAVTSRHPVSQPHASQPAPSSEARVSTNQPPIPIPPGLWFAPEQSRTLSHHELIASLAPSRVVLLGETHTRYDIHRWQLHVAAGLLATRGNIALGFEMFPRRVQPLLDDFVAGRWADPADFLAAVGWGEVWRFDAALYLPLFHFCRQFGVPMYALNCERPLVTRVGKHGWDSVPEAERDGLTPARPATEAYRAYLANIGDRNRGAAGGGPPAMDLDRFVRAQQTWDRAFACNIAGALAADDAPLVIGIIGRGHLEFGHGTPAQLADLGISDVAVLLPTESDFDPDAQTGIADALFRLPDTVNAA